MEGMSHNLLFAEMAVSDVKCAGAVGKVFWAPPAPDSDAYEKAEVLSFNANKRVSRPYKMRILVSPRLEENDGPFVECWYLADLDACKVAIE